MFDQSYGVHITPRVIASRSGMDMHPPTHTRTHAHTHTHTHTCQLHVQSNFEYQHYF